MIRTFVGAVGADVASVMVTVAPAIVIVPVRDDAVGFATTVYLTVPLPMPLGPEVIVIQAALLVDVQLHPAPVATLM